MAISRKVDQQEIAGWPPKPDGREVVLHTRVVTETGGGPDKTILMSAPFLADSPYWLAAAYMHPPEDPGFAEVRRRAETIGSPLISVPDRGALDRSVLRRMLAICKHYQVKVWHGHDYKSNLLGVALRPFWPMKLITTVHGWVKHTTKTPLYYAVDRWCLPYYHHVICVSDDLQERVAALGVPPERCSLIHNAIDERMYSRTIAPDHAPMRQQMGTPPGRKVVGAIGRLSPEKGFGDLIRAVHGLVTGDGDRLDIELWIAGDGDARPDLERQIKALGLEDRVKLLGFCSDPIAFYHALDLFTLSSLREGLPNVVLEAMSMSVPVVSTRVAGVPKMLTDGETGLLCPIGQPGELAEAMRRALTDSALSQRLVAAGRELIEREYSFTQRMAKVRAIYDQVLGAPQSQADDQGLEAAAASLGASG